MQKADELYQRFQERLTGVAGECCHVDKAELISTVKKVLEEKKVSSVSVFESPLMRKIGLTTALNAAGIVVHTDQILKNAATDKAGITEVQYGIADVGTLVQTQQDVDGRIASTLVDVQISLLKRSTLVDKLDTMMDMLSELPQIPNFVGFITGPSRTADIECVSTIGVHGPRQVMVIVVDDE